MFSLLSLSHVVLFLNSATTLHTLHTLIIHIFPAKYIFSSYFFCYLQFLPVNTLHLLFYQGLNLTETTTYSVCRAATNCLSVSRQVWFYGWSLTSNSASLLTGILCALPLNPQSNPPSLPFHWASIISWCAPVKDSTSWTWSSHKG